jgi:hypothetical protein
MTSHIGKNLLLLKRRIKEDLIKEDWPALVKFLSGIKLFWLMTLSSVTGFVEQHS